MGNYLELSHSFFMLLEGKFLGLKMAWFLLLLQFLLIPSCVCKRYDIEKCMLAKPFLYDHKHYISGNHMVGGILS